MKKALLLTGLLALGWAGYGEIVWTRSLTRDYTRYIGWPTALRTSGGEILAVFSGDRAEHVCPYGKVQLVRSPDDGETWSVPETICNCAIDDRDAGILELPNRDLVLFWFTSLAFYEEKYARTKHPVYAEIYKALTDDTRRMLLGSWSRRSTDGGKTWSQPVRVPVMTPHGGKLLKDGRILIVGVRNRQTEGQLVTDPNPAKFAIQAVESTDGGRSFRTIGTIPLGKIRHHWSLSEPTVYEHDDGTLTALVRYEVAPDGSFGPGKVYPRYLLRSESTDGGRTWSPLVRSNIDGFPPHVLRLKDGRFLCSYASRTPGRTGVYASFSHDGGKTWDVAHETTLFRDGDADLGYASSVENGDGTILTVFYAHPAKGRHAALMGTKWRANP